MTGLTDMEWRGWILGALAAAVAPGLLAACAGGGDPPPRILSGDESRVEIVAGLESSPRKLAEAHCELYGRRAVVRDTVPLGDNQIRGWATGRKGFIYTFDCY